MSDAGSGSRISGYAWRSCCTDGVGSGSTELAEGLALAPLTDLAAGSIVGSHANEISHLSKYRPHGERGRIWHVDRVYRVVGQFQ